MEHRTVYLNILKIPERLRHPDESKVESIAASMDEIGLQQPISVWESKDKVTVQLVAGAHRVAAAKKLRWDKVDCIVVDLDDRGRSAHGQRARPQAVDPGADRRQDRAWLARRHGQAATARQPGRLYQN